MRLEGISLNTLSFGHELRIFPKLCQNLHWMPRLIRFHIYLMQRNKIKHKERL